MKINVLTSRVPYPLEKGDKLRLYHQIKLLALHHEVHLFCISDGNTTDADLNHLYTFCKSIKLYPINKINRLWMVFTGIFFGLPFHVGYFYKHSLKGSIQNDLKANNPDLVYCQLVRVVPYLKGFMGRIWLDFMDSFSANLKKRFYFAPWWEKIWLKWEIKRMVETEQRAFKIAGHYSIISDQDKKDIDPKNEHNIFVLPNGVDLEYFHPNEYHDELYDICFTGNLGYHPNIKAANYLIKRIGKKLEQDITIRITGARPGRALKRMSNTRYVIEGWIDDIREVYWTGKIFVAPLFTGSGQQNKILEAMACGLPVVTTSLVNNAIGAIPGKEIFIADNLKTFLKIIDDLLDDEDMRKQTSYNAREFVENKFNWSLIGESMERFLLKIKTPLSD
ncbi:MAG: glycosyltransferase [Saprospiraceae bacterium]|nr:glycosyltransferase [Saprospiraceae bacterium]